MAAGLGKAVHSALSSVRTRSAEPAVNKVANGRAGLWRGAVGWEGRIDPVHGEN